jgi:hypothetical protein
MYGIRVSKRRFVGFQIIYILLAQYVFGFIPPISFRNSPIRVYCSGYQTTFMHEMNLTLANPSPGATASISVTSMHEGDVFSVLGETNATKGIVVNGTYVDANSNEQTFSTETRSDWRVFPGIPRNVTDPNPWTFANRSTCSWPSVVVGDAAPSTWFPSLTPVWSDLYYNNTGIRTTLGTPNSGCQATIRTTGIRNISMYINGLAVTTVTNPYALRSIFQTLKYGDVIAVMLHYALLQNGKNGFTALIETEYGRWDTANTSLWRAAIANTDWSSGISTSWKDPDLPEACNWAIPAIETTCSGPSARFSLNLTYITMPGAVPGDFAVFRTVIGVGEGNGNCAKQNCLVSAVDCCY